MVEAFFGAVYRSSTIYAVFIIFKVIVFSNLHKKVFQWPFKGFAWDS